MAHLPRALVALHLLIVYMNWLRVHSVFLSQIYRIKVADYDCVIEPH